MCDTLCLSWGTRCPSREKQGERGAQLRAMMLATTMPRDLAAEYS